MNVVIWSRKVESGWHLIRVEPGWSIDALVSMLRLYGRVHGVFVVVSFPDREMHQSLVEALVPYAAEMLLDQVSVGQWNVEEIASFLGAGFDESKTPYPSINTLPPVRWFNAMLASVGVKWAARMTLLPEHGQRAYWEGMKRKAPVYAAPIAKIIEMLPEAAGAIPEAKAPPAPAKKKR